MRKARTGRFGCGYILLVLAIGSLFLILGGFGLVSGLSANAQRQTNVQALQTVTAKITNCQAQQANTQNSHASIYLISYTFTYNNQTYANQALDGSPCDSASAQVGQPINVRFLPGDPTISGLDPFRFLPENTMLPLLGGAAALLGLMLLYGGLVAALRRLRG
jgi:hypothetical protein